jgi:fucose permease
MVRVNTTADLESTHHHDQRLPSELDSLIQHSDYKPSKKQARLAFLQFLSFCSALFMVGWTDGSTGPLLPTLTKHYGIGFGTVSWIFVSNCSGMFTGALLNMPLVDRIGLGNMVVIGSLLQISAFFAESRELPFPLFVISFYFGGAGMVFQDACANGFIATLSKDSEFKMSMIHAAYGVGALLAPLSSTYFAQQPRWANHYLVSTSLAVFNLFLLVVVFRFQTQDVCRREIGEIVHPRNVEDDSPLKKFGHMMTNKAVHLLSIFLLVYIGVEVTIGGWTASFLMLIRNGGPKSGYVSTGFFGGLTLGRVILFPITDRVGAVNAIYFYTLIAIFFQLIVWLVPSFIASAISVSIIGMVLGPMYPIAIHHTTRVIPRHLVTGTVGWMSAFGQAGSALLPFITGTMAAQLGIQSLQPFLFVMMIVVGVVWAIVPKSIT